VTGWDAREWLDGVREAVRVLEVEQQARKLRRESCLAISDPLAHDMPGFGSSDPMGRVDELVDDEAGYAERMQQLGVEVADCRAVVAGMHKAGMDDEAYAVDFHILYRLSWADVATAAHMSPATAQRRYGIACDLIQTVGLSRAKDGDFSPIQASTEM
jgi:acetyl esterase/lipase